MAALNYIKSIGRRKAAIATVRFFSGGSGKITINEKTFEDYFSTALLQQTVLAPLEQTHTREQFDIEVHVRGGGVTGQAESVRLGIARSLIIIHPELRTTLKKLGFLRRDARVRERKKYGLRSARRAPQWAKR